jgi:TRAP-type C4-dicarboxylate transport system permease small subunit
MEPASPEAEQPESHAPAAVRRALDVWHRGECWLAVAAFAFIAIILVLDVSGRELIGPAARLLGLDIGPTGIFASQRLSIFALVIGAFAGVGIATATGSHLVPRVGYAWAPDHWGPVIDRLGNLLTGVFLLGVAYYGFVFVQSTFEADLRTPMLDWVIWPVQTAIPIGFISAACRYFFYARWPDLRPKPPEVQE